MPIDYQQIVGQSILRLADLVRQRRRLDSEIARLQGFLRSIVRRVPETSSGVPVSSDEATLSSDQLGITKAVAQILQTYQVSLTPVLIRDLLPCVGFDPSRYKDPLTSIHVVLKRLVMSGQVRRERPGGHGYVWTNDSAKINVAPGQSQVPGYHAEIGGEFR
jgi:hypothetical protein